MMAPYRSTTHGPPLDWAEPGANHVSTASPTPSDMRPSIIPRRIRARRAAPAWTGAKLKPLSRETRKDCLDCIEGNHAEQALAEIGPGCMRHDSRRREQQLHRIEKTGCGTLLRPGLRTQRRETNPAVTEDLQKFKG